MSDCFQVYFDDVQADAEKSYCDVFGFNGSIAWVMFRLIDGQRTVDER